jgi:hypothetical protein
MVVGGSFFQTEPAGSPRQDFIADHQEGGGDFGAGALAVVIIAWWYATEDGQSRNFLRCPPLPCHCELTHPRALLTNGITTSF